MHSNRLDARPAFASATRAHTQELVRQFLARLRATDPLLFYVGLVLQSLVVPFAMVAVAVSHRFGQGVVDPWIKPTKFALSLSALLWTVSPMLFALRLTESVRRVARGVLAAGAGTELALVAAQAYRGSLRSTPAAPIDTLLRDGAAAAISSISAVCLWMTVLWFIRGRATVEDRALRAAVRGGLVIFMLGSAIGGFMLGRGSQTVGATPGGHTLPFINWSATGGDIRVSHFLAIHAIQILPLMAVAVRGVWPDLSVVRRTHVARLAGVVLFVIVMGTFVQALTAHPLFSIGPRP